VSAPSDVLVLNGPNLNLLGRREPDIYGATTLDEIEADLRERAASRGLRVACMQSNHEGALIDRLQGALDDGTRAVLLNPGGLTHTSVALRDAVAVVAAAVPVIEVHLSVPEAREPFRHVSLIAGVVSGRISGFGPLSYPLALEAALRLVETAR
jgi:3-dehydroquinate dehydratase-2